MLPTFAHVRASRAFAHGVQAQGAHNAQQIAIIRASSEPHAQPRRPLMRAGKRRWMVGQNVKWGCHELNRDHLHSKPSGRLQQPHTAISINSPNSYREVVLRTGLTNSMSQMGPLA